MRERYCKNIGIFDRSLTKRSCRGWDWVSEKILVVVRHLNIFLFSFLKLKVEMLSAVSPFVCSRH